MPIRQDSGATLMLYTPDSELHCATHFWNSSSCNRSWSYLGVAVIRLHASSHCILSIVCWGWSGKKLLQQSTQDTMKTWTSC